MLWKGNTSSLNGSSQLYFLVQWAKAHILFFKAGSLTFLSLHRKGHGGSKLWIAASFWWIYLLCVLSTVHGKTGINWELPTEPQEKSSQKILKFNYFLARHSTEARRMATSNSETAIFSYLVWMLKKMKSLTKIILMTCQRWQNLTLAVHLVL